LEETNPDIKRFVKKIADQELAEYRRDMAEYNRYIKDQGLSKPTTKSNSKSKKRNQPGSGQSFRKEEEGATVSPSPQSRRVTLRQDKSSHHLFTPNSSVLHLPKRQPSPVLGNELKGFSYFPARKRRS
jgi:hypothetical protein